MVNNFTEFVSDYPMDRCNKRQTHRKRLENKAINEILKQICSANEACHIFRGAAGGKMDGIEEVLQWKVGLLSIPIYII